MAVDNLPCELPKDASEGFGAAFVKDIIPAFFNGDKLGILERSRMTKNRTTHSSIFLPTSLFRRKRIASKKPVYLDRLFVKNNVKVKVRRF